MAGRHWALDAIADDETSLISTVPAAGGPATALVVVGRSGPPTRLDLEPVDKPAGEPAELPRDGAPVVAPATWWEVLRVPIIGLLVLAVFALATAWLRFGLSPLDLFR